MTQSTPQKTAEWPKLRNNLVAILRGIEPAQAKDVALALVDAGIEAIEVPLNSPEPFRSIEIMAKAVPTGILVGAGTVLSAQDTDLLHEAGGRLMISPNIDGSVMARAKLHQMVTMPGVFSPTEALKAVSLGATALKFFPASVLGPSGIGAMMAVLPRDTIVGAVGGVSEAHFADYKNIGVQTFGLGSSLYRPGMATAEIATRAQKAVSAWHDVFVL